MPIIGARKDQNGGGSKLATIYKMICLIETKYDVNIQFLILRGLYT